MKKHVSLFLSILIIFTVMISVPVYAEERPSTDITIANYTTSPTSNIQNGQSFTLNLTLKKNTSDTVTNLFITINESDSFVPSGTGSRIPINKEFDIDNQLTTEGISLKYIGGSSRTLSLTITATITDSEGNALPFSSTEYISISVVPPSNDPVPGFDPNDYVPILKVTNTNMPKATAGRPFKLALTINNTSIYGAKDITITPEYAGEGSDPFRFETMQQSGYIEKIDGQKSEEIVFDYTIAPNTPTGIYELVLNYSFYNHFGMQNPFTSSEKIRVEIVNNKETPSLSISKINYPENGLPAGSTVPVTLFFKNQGTLPARDVNITLQGLKTGGFTIEGNSNYASITTLGGGFERQVTFNLTVADEMIAGSHELTAQVDYKDDAGTQYADEYQFFLPVKKQDPAAYGVQIQNIVVPQKAFQVGENIPVRFKLTNIGETKVYNIKVSLNGEQVLIPMSPSIKVYNMLNPGQSEELEFIFSATTDAITRNYPIAIHVEYEVDQGGERQNILQYVGVFIENENAGGGEEGKSVPKIIIDSYSTDPVIVRAGSNFTLKISFNNTHNEKKVKNIKINFAAPTETESGSVFTPVNSSNTFYIDSIDPKSSVEMERVFYTVPDAQPKTYTVIANFEYEYDGFEGSAITAQEQIGIPVVQQTRLETSLINMPPTAYMGQPIPLFFEFYNMGKVTLSNLMITIEGDFTNQNPNYFVGNFEPGYSDYYDTTLFPNSTGQLVGSVLFEYDDAAGEHQEIRKEFTVMVEEMPAEVFYPDYPGDRPSGPDIGIPENRQDKGIMGFIKNPIVWGTAVFIILLTALVIFLKKRKKRKEMVLDE